MNKFEVSTPLGFLVRTTESYWRLLLSKHPEISGREQDIEQTLAAPTLVCRSRCDSAVYLFYRVEGDYYLCVIAKRLNGETDSSSHHMLPIPSRRASSYGMAHIRVIHDPIGETLTVYFSEPRTDQVCEEMGEGVILIKDRRSGEIIGFERLYYKSVPGPQTVTVETLTADQSGV